MGRSGTNCSAPGYSSRDTCASVGSHRRGVPASHAGKPPRGEFGTTTGRPRRCGWLDIPIARYATRINGTTDFVITKLDVLTGWEQIPVCVAYDIGGERHEELPMTQSEFHHAEPVYEYFDGWQEDISACRTLDDLPKAAQVYVKAIEDMTGTPVSAVGVGPGRDETVVVRDLL